MAIGRYTFAGLIDGGVGKSNPRISSKIFLGVMNGAIPFTSRKVELGERLDQIAAKSYGNPDYWWVIAAASGIGWGLQVPRGTIIRIPNDLSTVLNI